MRGLGYKNDTEKIVVKQGGWVKVTRLLLTNSVIYTEISAIAHGGLSESLVMALNNYIVFLPILLSLLRKEIEVTLLKRLP